jgi:phenylalanyl-tRNA synthetase beta chain
LKVSLNWLKEFIEIPLGPSELADRLTMQGLAVDGVEHVLPDMQGIVVGRVDDVVKHPNADKLIVCHVDCGKGSPIKVVCGATNVREGSVYPFAPPGSRLPGGFELKEVEIRGEKSSGMLCSGKELEISPDADNILDLEGTLKIGADLVTELNLEDYIFDIDVTANRFDLLSHIGVAREIKALVGGELIIPEHTVRESGEDVNDLASIDLEDPDGCPRYMARIVRGVEISPSPFWLSRRLETLGLRSVNNVVDVSNYVLLELGHPLHTFDLKTLKDQKVIVRRASAGEEIVTLDGEKRELDKDVLVIADGENPIAIAGIMGGLDTEVGDDTADVLIECAQFQPILIRKSSRRLALSTQASFRFERWVDINCLPLALDRVTYLIHELAGGKVCSGWIDRYPKEINGIDITLRPERTKKLLGTKMKKERMTELLESIDLTVEDEDKLLKVNIPTSRQDLVREVDLIEEIARLVGYDRIEATEDTGSGVIAEIDHVGLRRNRVKTHLVSHGFREVYTTSFLSPDEINLVFPDVDQSNLWPLENPISNDARVLRQSLLPGLLRVMKLNVTRNNHDLKIFEMGTTFGLVSKGSNVPEESLLVSGLMTGRKSPVHWNNSSPERIGFFDMKGVLNSLLKGMGYPGAKYVKTERKSFHPGRNAVIEVDGKEIGFFGELHPSVVKILDLQDQPLLFELDGNFFERIEKVNEYVEMSPFPSVKRDLSLLVPEKITHNELEEGIRVVGRDLLEEITLYDIYRGSQVPSGREALTFALVFRSAERTLKDEEVDSLMEKIFIRMEKEFNVTLRPSE